MSAPALSERDLAALRSFASRIDPSDAGAHNNLGVLYYQKGLIPEAVAAFGRALELDPRMQVAQTNLELAYRENGHYDRRVAELRERLRLAPNDLDARWELGRAYAALGHHDDAVVEFETLVAADPGSASALVQLGMAEKARGNIEAAVDWFRKACVSDPGSPVAFFAYGEALYNRGLNEPALTALRAAVSRNPDYADAHYLLAFVHGDMGDHDAARAAAKRAIALNPLLGRAQANLALGQPEAARPVPAEGPGIVGHGALAHFTLGLAFRQKGYFAEALREYRLALDAGEDRRHALQAMAEVELLRRDLPAALELYETLVTQFGDSPKLWNERGVCLHQSGRLEQAAASYARAVDLDPAYALAWNNLGVIRAQNPEDAGALEAFRRAASGPRAPVTARLNLALLHFQRHEIDRALEGYRQVLAEQPTSAVAWNGVGLVLVELKRYADAKNAFARAVEAEPTLAAAHYNLSFSLSQLGDFDGALRATKQALELEPYYVPQKYVLAIDLQYEDPSITVAPALRTDVGGEALAGSFAFDPASLHQLFEELAPAPMATAEPVAEDPLGLARDFIAKGLLELATAELERARGRGVSPSQAAALWGDIFSRRGFHGEALERYREARTADPDSMTAALGEVRSLLALGQGAEAVALTATLAERRPGDGEVLFARARALHAAGQSTAAMAAVKLAQAAAPGRPDLYQLQALIAAELGDTAAALEACQVALQLDGTLVQVWFELGRLEEARENWSAARAAYQRSLELLPTYLAPALALADLARRVESPAAAIHVLVDLLSADPYELDALTLLGRTLLDDGRPSRALEALDRVLRFDPDHAGALFFRGVALARERQFRDAVSAWDRVVQLEPTGQFASQARARARSARDLEHIFSPAG